MSIISGTVVVLLSTLKPGDNLFTRMMKLQRDDRSFLFESVQLVYICNDCKRKSDLEHGDVKPCVHMIPFMPKHHSKSQMADLRIFNKGREAIMAMESMNLDIGIHQPLIFQYIVFNADI